MSIEERGGGRDGIIVDTGGARGTMEDHRLRVPTDGGVGGGGDSLSTQAEWRGITVDTGGM